MQNRLYISACFCDRVINSITGNVTFFSRLQDHFYSGFEISKKIFGQIFCKYQYLKSKYVLKTQKMLSTNIGKDIRVLFIWEKYATTKADLYWNRGYSDYFSLNFCSNKIAKKLSFYVVFSYNLTFFWLYHVECRHE